MSPPQTEGLAAGLQQQVAGLYFLTKAEEGLQVSVRLLSPSVEELALAAVWGERVRKWEQAGIVRRQGRGP
jgi:hypothetical protein